MDKFTVDKFNELLTALKGEDDLGVVIRSQIIIEQYLNSLIKSFLKSPKHLKKMELDYSRTLKLAISLGLDPKLEPTLKALGTMRNKFAHNLKPAITKQDAKNLYKTLDPENKSNLQSSFNGLNEEFAIPSPPYEKLPAREQYISIRLMLCFEVLFDQQLNQRVK